MLTAHLKSVYWSEKLLNYSVIILRTPWQDGRQPWVFSTRWQVLSWQVKIQVRIAIMTGVCYTEQQVISDCNKVTGLGLCLSCEGMQHALSSGYDHIASLTEFGERRAPSKCCIQKLVKKLETTGSLLTQHAGGRKMSEETIQDVKEWLLASPSKSLRRLSQETISHISRVKELQRKQN